MAPHSRRRSVSIETARDRAVSMSIPSRRERIPPADHAQAESFLAWIRLTTPTGVWLGRRFSLGYGVLVNSAQMGSRLQGGASRVFGSVRSLSCGHMAVTKWGPATN
jgi:hypothetical protein